MEGTYPLKIDGTEVGEVSVRTQGGWTLFEVRACPLPGIVRVSVYGAGREGYLGVLAPEGEGLCLQRRLSRSALRDFPERIEFAGRAGLPSAPEAASDPVPEPTPPPAPEPEPQREPEPAPVEEAESEAEAGRAPAPEPAGICETPVALEDVYWYASPDGALVCFDGEQNLIALPVGDDRIPAGGGWPKTIEGRDYVVYRTKDGKLVR